MEIMFQSMQHGDYLKALCFIENSNNVNICDGNGETPLIKCVFMKEESKAVGLARALLENGASISHKDRCGLNVLHYCCIEQLPLLVEVILSAIDCNINSVCHKTGNTALHFSAISGNQDIAQKLVNHLQRYKLSVDLRNISGATAFQLALGFRHTAIVKLLMLAGANTNIVICTSVKSRNQATGKPSITEEMLPIRKKAQPKPMLRKRIQTPIRAEAGMSVSSHKGSKFVELNKQSPAICGDIKRRQSGILNANVNMSWRETIPQMWRQYAHQHSKSFRMPAIPQIIELSPETTSATDGEERDIISKLNEPIDVLPNYNRRRHSSIVFSGSRQLPKEPSYQPFKSTSSRTGTNNSRRRSVAVF